MCDILCHSNLTSIFADSSAYQLVCCFKCCIQFLTVFIWVFCSLLPLEHDTHRDAFSTEAFVGTLRTMRTTYPPPFIYRHSNRSSAMLSDTLRRPLFCIIVTNLVLRLTMMNVSEIQHMNEGRWRTLASECEIQDSVEGHPRERRLRSKEKKIDFSLLLPRL